MSKKEKNEGGVTCTCIFMWKGASRVVTYLLIRTKINLKFI